MNFCETDRVRVTEMSGLYINLFFYDLYPIYGTVFYEAKYHFVLEPNKERQFNSVICCKEKQADLIIFENEITCVQTLNGKFRAKFEKKLETFWRNEISTLILVNKLG